MVTGIVLDLLTIFSSIGVAIGCGMLLQTVRDLKGDIENIEKSQEAHDRTLDRIDKGFALLLHSVKDHDRRISRLENKVDEKR